MNPTSQFRRLVAIIVLPMFLFGCTKWQVQEMAPAQFIEEEQPEKIRVTRTDGTKTVLENPQVSGDTLSGVREGLGVTISLSSVEALAVRKTDVGASIATGFLVVVVLLGIAVVAVCASDDLDCSN